MRLSIGLRGYLSDHITAVFDSRPRRAAGLRNNAGRPRCLPGTGIRPGANTKKLNKCRSLQLDTVAADLGKVVLSLLYKPALLAAAENRGQPYGHFWRDATLSI